VKPRVSTCRSHVEARIVVHVRQEYLGLCVENSALFGVNWHGGTGPTDLSVKCSSKVNRVMREGGDKCHFGP